MQRTYLNRICIVRRLDYKDHRGALIIELLSVQNLEVETRLVFCWNRRIPEYSLTYLLLPDSKSTVFILCQTTSRKKPSYIAGGKASWCIHSRKKKLEAS
jgi:hypothetical protein